MKVQVTGKVVERSTRPMKDGAKRYQIVIEEPGNFPSPFAFSSKNSELFGPSNGFAAVGNIVTAVGFANGRCEEIPRKDGSGTFKKYSVYFTLSALQPYASAPAGSALEANASSPRNPASDPAEIEDVPF